MLKFPGDTISAVYKHATAVLAADSIKNAAGSKLFITLAGGGGGGGRGYRVQAVAELQHAYEKR